jgi:acetylornithine deacetylase/succinyl-diaminopimelate desuccinylase-like protein
MSGRTEPGAAAVAHCRELLRIDTSNPGAVEEPAARYVVDALSAAGVDSEVVEPQPGRCSVISRMRGADPELSGLLVHAHLDVVPAGDGWTRDPFGAEEADGCLWGRGALDMKATVATMLAAQAALASVPRRRDIVFAYFADEEMGGGLGAGYVARERPHLLAGVTEAIGEIGGFTVHLEDGRRLHPIQCGEKAMVWMEIVVPGEAGHAALSDAINPLPRLGELITAIDALRLDETPPSAHIALLEQAVAMAPAGTEDPLAVLGAFGRMAAQGARTRFRPTVAAAGGKVNVLPDAARTIVDCRCLPGRNEDAVDAVRALLREGETLEVLQQSRGAVTEPSGPLYDACVAALRRADPDGVPVPFVFAAGSDVQHFGPLGITGYGFAPLTLPPGFGGVPDLFHAPDERVPIDAIAGGTATLLDLLRSY